VTFIFLARGTKPTASLASGLDVLAFCPLQLASGTGDRRASRQHPTPVETPKGSLLSDPFNLYFYRFRPILC
jgi:hypothetical protein